ncbi:Inositol-tetrakisphosphate 1-kinase [Habropoda laboriosa]|uniref:Inositol-tetrakisphosphate 1-kinase n=1 Tax=Habropoda laboriosa TaxID=597456 RepID=A0A0L7QP61_9HYME|nr:PREDICTED: inositol-tetrakisphosphate 1-kinase-like [Habropoda laboriosa]KOC60339.1 Inositol-tetrakisphosphate 1-kinase [Habropoda laboriosa]
MCDKYVIGYSISEKKRQKFNWNDFYSICESEGFLLKMIDINSDLESQGPFHVFIHKLTDKFAHAENGDQNAKAIISRINEYFCQHPEIIVIDSLDNIKILINRYKSYEILQEHLQLNDVFTPRFIEIKSKSNIDNMSMLKMAGIKFPFICKPLVAQGSNDAHKMMVIFNEQGLNDCLPPCVAQEFINHNAILYKIYIVGEHFHVVERPSFKNFYEEDCTILNTIFFRSHDISKSDSRSKWSILSEEDIPLTVKPKHEILEKIVKKITELFGLLLVGVDVVIENHTGKYAIIDVNIFPGYDSYPNFFEQLITCIKKLSIGQKKSQQHSKIYMLKKCLSDDLDSGFESDEKKKYSIKTNK